MKNTAKTSSLNVVPPVCSVSILYIPMYQFHGKHIPHTGNAQDRGTHSSPLGQSKCILILLPHNKKTHISKRRSNDDNNNILHAKRVHLPRRKTHHPNGASCKPAHTSMSHYVNHGRIGGRSARRQSRCVDGRFPFTFIF